MRNTKSQFLALLCFVVVATLLLTNGFTQRIFAQKNDTDVYRSIEPIGEVLSEIMANYVEKPDINKVVEGALTGMMNSLDPHSSYIKPDLYKELTDDTRGEFEGIGVSIKMDDNNNIVVFQPIEGSPASKAGIHSGDYIVEVDGVSTEGMSLADVASRIKGPRGTVVKLKVFRQTEDKSEDNQLLDFDIKRDKVPLQSVSELRVLPGNIGYLRLTDFKSNSAEDMRKDIEALLKKGMKGFVLDLRWNPGGLLTASKEVCELFLPKRTMVTYTKGRVVAGSPSDEMILRTERNPILPTDFPMIILVSRSTASSAEIVTSAMQYYARAIIVGEKTYGKGSVQTIIPLKYPAGSALRLTTALYYTPADVTINNRGIIPDVEVPMTQKQQRDLIRQMLESYSDDPNLKDKQNHGEVTGNKETPKTVEDLPLEKAVQILNEDPVFEHLIAKYHKDPSVTQVAAITPKDGKSAKAGTSGAVDEAPPAEN